MEQPRLRIANNLIELEGTMRHSIPERCNRPAWRTYPNGYRVCLDHARVNDPDETLHPNMVGPCDYPMDGLGAARYESDNA